MKKGFMNKIKPLERRICSLCGESVKLSIIYNGLIRSGGIGSEFVDGYKVIECASCGFTYLNRVPDDIQLFYESNAYRESFDYKIDISSMQQKFDPDQNERIERIGIENIRDSVVADFGAGPGVFIDAIRSVARNTIVVEPSEKYRGYLTDRGHECYPYVEQMLEKHKGMIDVAVSFDTIEHILDANDFAKKIYQALNVGGVLYLSMPNLDDVVRSICPIEYEPFFFQVAHLNYFNKKSACHLLRNAGFKDVSVDYIHKYDINNIFRWIKSGKPGRFNSGAVFDRAFHSHFNVEVERLGVASHLFITATK